MKKKLTTAIFLIMALGANAQKQTQNLPAFPMENGKVVYRDTAVLKDTSFKRRVKTGLNDYARQYNDRLNNEPDMMKDYIFYEDSLTVDANVKYKAYDYILELLNSNANFERRNDTVFITVKKIVSEGQYTHETYDLIDGSNNKYLEESLPNIKKGDYVIYNDIDKQIRQFISTMKDAITN